MEQHAAARTRAFAEDLNDLRATSLQSILLIMVLVAHLWACWLAWPVTGANAPPEAWAGLIALITGLGASYALRQHDLRFASLVLISALVAANGAALSAFGGHILPYLFTPSVIFASLLLGRRALLLVATATSAVVVYMGLTKDLWPLIDAAGPVAVILLTALASWISTRNLYTALAWSRSSTTGSPIGTPTRAQGS
jgi:hypothetical protein